MNLAQYDLRSRAGVLTSEPRIVPGALQTVVVNHAMDRGPDLALVRLNMPPHLLHRKFKS